MTPKQADRQSPDTAGDGGDGPGAWRSPDRLDYLADMISELREIADRSGYRTLSGILALAVAEVEQQCALQKAQRD